MLKEVKIYPTVGITYCVTIDVPANVFDVDAYIDEWIEDNLIFVEHYRIIDNDRRLSHE